MFRQLVERALNEVWDGFRELGERYPRLAPTLTRDANEDLAALVQTTAFALASIDEHAQDDGQSLLRPLVARALPECLRPRPAMTILELPSAHTHSGNAQGVVFSGRAASIALPFVVMWPVAPGPYAVREVRVDRPHATLQTLRVVLEGRDGATLENVLPDRVRFFVHMDPPTAALDVLHALRTAEAPMEIETFDAEGHRLARGHLPREAFAWVGVDTEEPPLVSAPVDRFPSGSHLGDLFVFPERYFFFEVALAAFRAEKVARIELTLPFGRVVERASAMNLSSLRLFCAPATNQYETTIESLRKADGPEWTIVAAKSRHAEILHVQAIYMEGKEGPIPIVSLEAPDQPQPLGRDLHYYRLEQAIARDDSRTILRLSLATRDGFRAPAPATLEGTVLASDGILTEKLGLGDVGGRNITRVSPSRRANLGLAMRMNAFGRMSPRRFAEPEHLNAFLRLHDFAQSSEYPVRIPSCIQTTHRIDRRALPGATWQNGDDFEVRIDTTSCSDGEAWLQCHLLSCALAERNDALRFSRLTVLRERGRHRETFARYDARDGERYSFPNG